ncbi:MAG: hypothetical protein GF334_09660 [Candidatus Altiarchaeales archaeon]|nr:hypothetical protein [Candidatus Altiarchaeales archaeon]
MELLRRYATPEGIRRVLRGWRPILWRKTEEQEIDAHREALDPQTQDAPERMDPDTILEGMDESLRKTQTKLEDARQRAKKRKLRS